MQGPLGTTVVDSPAVALATILVSAGAVYAVFQFAFDGAVDVFETVTFAVIFAGVFVALSIAVRRAAG